VEQKLLLCSGAVRSKAEWCLKVDKKDVESKWKEEFQSQMSLSEEEVEFIMAHVHYLKSLSDMKEAVVSAVEGVWQVDDVVDQHLLSSLRELADVMRTKQMELFGKMAWHPNTNETVLDLVHPSLFCLVYNTTTSYPCFQCRHC